MRGNNKDRIQFFKIQKNNKNARNVWLHKRDEIRSDNYNYYTFDSEREKIEKKKRKRKKQPAYEAYLVEEATQILGIGYMARRLRWSAWISANEASTEERCFV